MIIKLHITSNKTVNTQLQSKKYKTTCVSDK